MKQKDIILLPMINIIVEKEIRNKVGIEVVEVLMKFNWIKSKNEGRRAIKQNLVKFNKTILVKDAFARIVVNDEHDMLYLVESI